MQYIALSKAHLFTSDFPFADTMYMKSRFNEVYYYIDADQKTELNKILDDITK